MNWIIYIISCVVDIFVLYVLFGSILEERRENIPLGFVFAGMFVQQLITTVVSQNVENPFANLGVQAVSCFLLTLFYYSGWIWRVVTAAVFLTIAVLSEGIAIAVAEQVGVKNIEYKLYENGRHEMLNEKNKVEVMEDTIQWLLKNI